MTRKRNPRHVLRGVYAIAIFIGLAWTLVWSFSALVGVAGVDGG